MEKSRRTAAWRLADYFVAAAHDDPDLALAILRSNRDLAPATSSWGESAAQAASHVGHRRLLGRLIDCGAPFDLFSACALGDRPAAVSRLVGTARDACGVHRLPILHFGIVSGDMSMVETLLDAGVAVNPPHASLPPLHSAAAVGSTPMFRRLIAAGADCSTTDAFGATAFDWLTAFDGQRRVIRPRSDAFLELHRTA